MARPPRRRGTRRGIEGGREAARVFQALSENVATAIEETLVKGALKIERDAKREVPVDTGRLRASITHRIKGAGSNHPQVEVGTNVKYAPFIEFGTGQRGSASSAFLDIEPTEGYQYGDRVGMPAQPFLFPAFNTNKEKIKQALVKAARKELGR